MRRILSLLLILTVVWCGSHLCEPAAAKDKAAAFSLQLDSHVALDDDGDEAPKGGGKAAHGGHHHCPVAGDQHAASDLMPCPPAEVPFASPSTPLGSLEHAPPLQPPSA